MIKSANYQWIYHKFLPIFTCYGLTALLSVIILSNAVEAKKNTELHIAQQSQPMSGQANPTVSETQAKVKTLFEKAKQLSQEAEELRVQPNPASRRQAITKNEELVKIWRLPELRAVNPKESRLFEAASLSTIGSLYTTFSENLKAVEYSEQALAIFHELKDNIPHELEATTLFLEATTQYQVALPYLNIGQKQKALNALEQARSLFSAENKTENVVLTWSGTSTIYGSSGEFKKGIEPLNKALEIQIANNLPGQAETISNLGDLYSQLGESEKALENYKKVLKNYRQTKDLFGQANILSSIGSFYSQKGERQQAEKYYEEALQLQKALEKQLQKTVLPGVFPDKGSELSPQEKFAAYSHLQQQITIVSRISTSYYVLGDSEKEIIYLNQLQSLNHQLGNTQYEADSIASIARVYSELGDKQKALGLLEQALKMQSSIKNLSGEGEILNEQAKIDLTSGEPQKALDKYNQAMNIFKGLQNTLKEAETCSNIADVYTNLGDYASSIRYYNQALEIYNRLENPHFIGATFAQLGYVFLKRGRTTNAPEDAKKADYDKALYYLGKARNIAQKEGIVIEQLPSLFGLARINEFNKNYSQAIADAKQALALSRQHELKYWERSSLTVLGRVYTAAGNYQKALDSTKESFLLSKKVGDLSEQATTLQIQGKSYTSMKQPQQAIEAYNQELALRQTMKDKAGEAFALYNIAVNEGDKGNLQQAFSQIKKTIEIVEAIRGKVKNQDSRTSYFASVQDYYKFYIDLLMQLHKKDPSKGYDALALHISERSRARVLLELLTEANANIRKGINPQLLAEEQNLEQQLDARDKRRQELLNKKATTIQKLEKKIADLRSQYQELQTKIRTSSPKYAALKYPEPLKLAQIQQQLDSDTLLLQYSLGKERSYLWAVTPNSINSYELPGGEAIETSAEKFKKVLRKCQELGIHCQKLPAEQKAKDFQEITQAATELSQLILAPVSAKLGKKRLVIVADGALEEIPFTALSEPNQISQLEKSPQAGKSNYQPLLVNHEIVNLPSVTAIATHREDLNKRQPAPKILAVLADPVFEADDERFTGKPASLGPELNFKQPSLQQAAKNLNHAGLGRLLGTRTEAEQILKLVPPSESLYAFDFDANYNLATSPKLKQYRFILFATHGFADLNEPELSGIVLSQINKQGKRNDPNILRLRDIFNLDWDADLVVLSACETGLGKDVQGEGLVGLTRGLMYAGAKTAVVSLWQVNDTATSELMPQFYTAMLQQKASPITALREAQLKLWQQEDWRNPYYWAAFTLQGEWR